MIVAVSPAPEQTRARYPDETGHIERGGVQVSWERYGSGDRTILLLPTWSIIHSRHWKAQIPFLARHWRVLTFDGRGNGRSDRPADAAAYADTEFVADAVAVMDATQTERAVIVGVSMGAGYALRLAAEHPDRVEAAVFEAPAILLDDPEPDARNTPPDVPLDHYEGWGKYNYTYWRRDYRDFAEFFFGTCFSEPHSTKQIEDCVGWALEIGPETLILTDVAAYLEGTGSAPAPGRTAALARSLAARVRCPTLVIQGGDDRIVGVDRGVDLAALLGSTLVRLEGAGHIPGARHPVRFNLALRDFITTLDRGT
ncbi:MAG TPA: alpha/beta hydrolase [Candidatus Limnocylindrales bacterium]